VHKNIVDYVYGELNPGEVLEFERHVRDCSACAKELGEMQFTRRAFGQAEIKVPSNGAVEKIIAAARESVEAPAPVRISPLRTVEFWRPLLVGAASVLFMMAIAQLVFHPFTVEKIVKVPVVQQPGPETLRPVVDPRLEPPRLISIPRDELDRLRKALPAVDDAISGTAAAGTIDDASANDMFNTAFRLFRNGYLYEAFCLLKVIDHKAPNYEYNYLVAMLIGKVYDTAGIYDRALKYYDTSITMKPDYAEALRSRIEELRRMQQVPVPHE
jgi:tetratricopeptide (TPR) repeat protein